MTDADAAGDGEQGGRLVAQPRPGDNAPPLSVGQLSQALKRAIEQGFGHVRVRGEISGFKRAASGHVYFALKDADGLIDAVMWKGQAARIAFAAEDGLDVIASGRVTTYPGRSKYQIVVDSLELAGEGALLALLEKTRQRLAAEGLFDAAAKRPLPFFPTSIAVVTSPTGAVIRDILHRLADRMPSHVLVWPVLVQGQGAAEQIAAAIDGLDSIDGNGGIARPDVIIVARGGGSIEDLWAFNEEIVVRAAARCTIPLISAVGHETDTTLIDYAADRRAPTPSAAAEMVVPVRTALVEQLGDIGLRAQRGWNRQAALRRERLDSASARLPPLDRLFAVHRQRLDDLADRLPQVLRLVGVQAGRRLAEASAALRPVLLQRRLDQARERVDALARIAQSLDPRALMARGFAIVRTRDGAIVSSAAAANSAVDMVLGFADGDVAVTAHANATPALPRRRDARRVDRDGHQPGLFD